MADAVAESKRLPHLEGTRFVVTRVVAHSERLDMIWKRASAWSREGAA